MFLAWEEMKHNRLKYSIITLVLVAVMYLVFFTIGLSRGIKNFGASKIINSSAQTFVLSEGVSDRLERSSMSSRRALEIKEQMGEDATIIGVTLANMTNVSSDSSDSFGVAYFAVETDTFLSPTLIEGRAPKDDREVIATPYIRNYGVDLGDKIHDSRMNVSFAIVGFAEDETYNYSPIVYLQPEQYSEVTFIGQMTGSSNVQSVVTMSSPSEVASDITKYNIDLSTKEKIIETTPGLAQQSASFTLLIASMYIISGTILAMFFYIVTIQKRKEFGQLRAFGASNRFIIGAVLGQVGIVTLIGIMVSTILILLTDAVLPPIVPFLLQWRYIVWGSLLFLGVAILGSLASVYETIKIDPIEAVGGNN